MNNNFLIVDLETTDLNINNAKIKIFGAYDPQQNKYFIYKWREEIISKVMKLFEGYKYIITFNGEKYDFPILENHGIPARNYSHIDVYKIYRNKGKYIRSGGFNSCSLKNLNIELGLDIKGKGDIDYEVFRRECWTPSEEAAIIDYCKQDLLCTWKLFHYASTKLSFLTKLLPAKDVDNYTHLLLNDDAYTYKAICNIAGVPELYDERPKYLEFPGRVTTIPRKRSGENILLLTLPSLYAFTIIQFNLLQYTCGCCDTKTNEGKYHGRGHYVIKGFYCQKNQGPVEKVLEKLYRDSLGDPEVRKYADIILENIYSVCTNAKYYSLYNIGAMQDLDKLVRAMIKEINSALIIKGYSALYIDGGELFIRVDYDNGQTIKDAINIVNDILAKIQNYMPYPSMIFKVANAEVLKYIEFFDRGEDTPFMFKNKYVAIRADNTIKSMNASKQEIEKVLVGRI